MIRLTDFLQSQSTPPFLNLDAFPRMPHADSSLLPDYVKTKRDFWEHVNLQANGLMNDSLSWVTNLANVSSLVYHSLMDFDRFGLQERSPRPIVNWCGFYIDSCLFPPNSTLPTGVEDPNRILTLGPFCGRPACQLIKAKKGGGVCADAYLSRETLVVRDVDAYPGHIACDGDTKSEIVIPIKIQIQDKDTQRTEEIVLGVMDLDSIVLGAFDEEDVNGLEQLVKSVSVSCKW